MNEKERWNFLVELDEELLKGGVMLSEWCAMITQEADTAFVHGAHLASILTAVAGIETYLRSEYAEKRRERVFELIENAPLEVDLQKDLHWLRKYRNKWVHVENPWEDQVLLDDIDAKEQELEKMAIFAARTLRRTLYENPWI